MNLCAGINDYGYNELFALSTKIGWSLHRILSERFLKGMAEVIHAYKIERQNVLNHDPNLSKK
jgi:hypothetical protein